MELYNKDIEKLVIGSIMGSKDEYDEAKAIINADCFYVDQYKQLYRCITEINESGNIADVFTIKSRMEIHGWKIEHYELLDILSNQSFSIAQYCTELHSLYVRRTVARMADRLKVDMSDPTSDPYEAVSLFSKRTESFYRTEESGISGMLDTLKELQNNVMMNRKADKPINGTPTGFVKFDEATSGLHKGDLIIVAAESSQGKSSIALNITVNAAKSGEKIAIYSMEMTRKQLVARMVSSEGGVSSSSILYKPLCNDDLIDVDNAMGRLSNLDIYFDDRSSSNIDNIIASIRYIHKRYGLNGAVVDYIQLLSINGRGQQTEEQALGEYARKFKNLAKELDIWVMALSQLSRDKNTTEPTRNRLRGSGQITEAADTIILLYRPEVYGITNFPEPFANVNTKDKALIIVDKGRNTGTMKFIVGFDAPRTLFYDLDSDYIDNTPPPPPINDIPQGIIEKIKETEQLPF